MKILIDMNLAPTWPPTLRKYGWECRHWSEVGDPRAPDHMILAWALTNGYIVITRDLDFGTILAATQASGPSLVLIRAQDVFIAQMEQTIVQVLRQFETLLDAGALIVLEETRTRALALPLRP